MGEPPSKPRKHAGPGRPKTPDSWIPDTSDPTGSAHQLRHWLGTGICAVTHDFRLTPECSVTKARASRPSTWRRPPSLLRQLWPRVRSAGTNRHLSSLTPRPPSCEAQGRSCAVWQRCGELPPNRYADPALAATDDLGSGHHVAERLGKVP